MKRSSWRLAALILSLTVALLASGCTSTPPDYGANPTLKQTRIDVEPSVTRYRNAVAEGLVTPGEQQQINAAYAKYHSAFEAALQAAGNNYDATTPDTVKRSAEELLSDLASL